MPQLLIGLGNPGDSYAATRHNAGFWLVNSLAMRLNITFTHQKKLTADVATAQNIRLIKPKTWMNNSGVTAAAAAAFYQVAAENILVAHDEVDLPPGTARFKFGGGTAGHNGLASICDKIGNNYWRLRLGVGRTTDIAMHNYVLQQPPATEATLIQNAIAQFFTVWDDVIANNYQSAMRTLHSDG